MHLIMQSHNLWKWFTRLSNMFSRHRPKCADSRCSFRRIETHWLVCRLSFETLLIHHRTAVPLLSGNSRKMSLKHYFTPRYILSHTNAHTWTIGTHDSVRHMISASVPRPRLLQYVPHYLCARILGDARD